MSNPPLGDGRKIGDDDNLCWECFRWWCRTTWSLSLSLSENSLTCRIRCLAMAVRPETITVSVGKWGFWRNYCGGRVSVEKWPDLVVPEMDGGAVMVMVGLV
ncbi:hypothetical protein Hanom_Chr05g00413041 [Helianthus anomalus]